MHLLPAVYGAHAHEEEEGEDSHAEEEEVSETMKGLLLILGVMVFYLVEKMIVMMTEHYGTAKPNNKI